MKWLSKRKLRSNLTILTLTSFLHMFGWGLFTPLYALYAIDLGAKPEEVGMTWAAYHLLAGVLVIFLGWFEDKIGDKPWLLSLGYGIQTVGIMVLYFATDQFGLLYGLGVYAVGLGLVMPLWQVVFNRNSHKGRRATEMGILHGGNQLLIALAALICGLVYAASGFRTLILLAAVLNVAATLLVLRVKR